ncbi:MAG TPA: ArsC family (seleno)protein [Planctomycetaceae bacterium]|jgi:arsenate reductase-like glutaredoxin family protein|nr:ArsC family (seleno)protein [Planctomycetaceae bacterium]
MASVDWYYHRPGCITCGKSQAFLERRKFVVKETVNAAKVRFEPPEALELARQASRVVVAKGKKVLDFDMKRDPPDDETLLAHIIGPSGKLRAPVIRRGSTLLIGFAEAEFAKVLGGK